MHEYSVRALPMLQLLKLLAQRAHSLANGGILVSSQELTKREKSRKEPDATVARSAGC